MVIKLMHPMQVARRCSAKQCIFWCKNMFIATAVVVRAHWLYAVWMFCKAVKFLA